VSGREAARSREWAQHFSNASCLSFHLSANFTDENLHAADAFKVLCIQGRLFKGLEEQSLTFLKVGVDRLVISTNLLRLDRQIGLVA